MLIPYRHSALSSVQPLNLVATSMSTCRPSTLFLTGGVSPHEVFPILSSDVSKLLRGGNNVDRIDGELIAISLTYQPLGTIPTNAKGTQDPKSYASKPSAPSTTSRSYLVSPKNRIFESTLAWYTLNPKFKNLNITFVAFDSYHHSPVFSEPVIIRDCFTPEKTAELWGGLLDEEYDLDQLSRSSFRRMRSWLKRVSLGCCTLVGGVRIAVILFGKAFTAKNKGRILHRLHSHST